MGGVARHRRILVLPPERELEMNSAPLDLKSFIEMLPQVDEVPLVHGGPFCDGVTYERGDEPEYFVEPELRVKTPIVRNDTSVVLIEAPGAVGKTTLAREIARRTGASLWDLSKRNVGHTFTDGTLARCFDRSHFDRTMTKFEQGEFLIVIDALDEGRVRARDVNFLPFLMELCHLCEAPRARPVIILLGRGGAVALAETYFELYLAGIGSGRRVPFAYLEIEFFGETTAKKFVGRRLDVICKTRKLPAMHRTQKKDYESVRDKVFTMIADALAASKKERGLPWEQRDARSVLGYAPVLEGIAEYLIASKVAHYGQLREALEKMQAGTRPTAVWELFVQIMDGILNREKVKVKQAVKAALEKSASGLGWSDWDSLYTPWEQRIRVLRASALGITSSIALETMPDVLRDEYEEIIAGQVDDHPFGGPDRRAADGFVSEVFRDDTYAWVLVTESIKNEDKERVHAKLTQATYKPSAIFARSYLARAAGHGESPIVPALDFGYIYESLAAHAHDLDGAALTMTTDDSSGLIVAKWWDRKPDPKMAIEPLVIRIEPNDQALLFPQRLKNARLSVSIPVIFGVDGADFYLGPTVSVSCPSLTLAGDMSINLGSPHIAEEDRSIVLTARKCEHGPKAPYVEGQGVLIVRWPYVQPPWKRYGGDITKPDDSKRYSYEVVDALRKLAIRGWRYVDLENDTIRSEFSSNVDQFGKKVVDILWDAGILIENIKQQSGLRRKKPAVREDVRNSLIEGQQRLATELALPDRVREEYLEPWFQKVCKDM
jgi:hypothetical protein